MTHSEIHKEANIYIDIDRYLVTRLDKANRYQKVKKVHSPELF